MDGAQFSPKAGNGRLHCATRSRPILLEDGYDIRTIQELLAQRREDDNDLHPCTQPWWTWSQKPG
jgi:hypothetical protein